MFSCFRKTASNDDRCSPSAEIVRTTSAREREATASLIAAATMADQATADDDAELVRVRAEMVRVRSSIGQLGLPVPASESVDWQEVLGTEELFLCVGAHIGLRELGRLECTAAFFGKKVVGTRTDDPRTLIEEAAHRLVSVPAIRKELAQRHWLPLSAWWKEMKLAEEMVSRCRPEWESRVGRPPCAHPSLAPPRLLHQPAPSSSELGCVGCRMSVSFGSEPVGAMVVRPTASFDAARSFEPWDVVVVQAGGMRLLTGVGETHCDVRCNPTILETRKYELIPRRPVPVTSSEDRRVLYQPKELLLVKEAYQLALYLSPTSNEYDKIPDGCVGILTETKELRRLCAEAGISVRRRAYENVILCHALRDNCIKRRGAIPLEWEPLLDAASWLKYDDAEKKYQEYRLAQGGLDVCNPPDHFLTPEQWAVYATERLRTYELPPALEHKDWQEWQNSADWMLRIFARQKLRSPTGGPQQLVCVVQFLTGRAWPCELPENFAVEKLKEMITNKEGIPADQLRLIATSSLSSANRRKSQQMEDGHTLSDYDAFPLLTVHVVLRLRGLRAPQLNADTSTYMATSGIAAAAAAGAQLPPRRPWRAPREIPQLLDRGQCRALVQFVESRYQEQQQALADSATCNGVDGSNNRQKRACIQHAGEDSKTDFLLEITEPELATVIGAAASTAVVDSCDSYATCGEGPWRSSFCSSKVSDARPRIVLRRWTTLGAGSSNQNQNRNSNQMLSSGSSTVEREGISFHRDPTRSTLNVALVDDNTYIGGRLMYIDNTRGGKVVCPARQGGSALVHDGSLAHAVSELQNGTRYSLFAMHEMSLD